MKGNKGKYGSIDGSTDGSTAEGSTNGSPARVKKEKKKTLRKDACDRVIFFSFSDTS